MGDHQIYYRNCDCRCHGSDRRCRDHGNCRIPDDDARSISTISTISLGSLATIDNKPGAGRGLDQLFQFLGRHFERNMAVALDRLGFGPAAVERRALKIISKLDRKVGYDEQRRGKSVLEIPSEAEMIKLQTDLDECCKLLLYHLRSSAPTTQYFALNALWRLRCANPLRVDNAFKTLGFGNVVDSIHDSLELIERHPSKARTLWRSQYVRSFDGDLLDTLLASSRKALIAVNDNELHSAAKSLLQLKGGYDNWILERCPYVVQPMRILSKFILDPDLAFMAVAYVERIGLNRSPFYDGEALSVATVSIVENLRAVCSFHANHLNAEGKVLPDAYWTIIDRFDQIDALKFFFPPEERKRLTLPAANSCAASPAAVDWQQLEDATYRAWVWILDELIAIARNEGRHEFLRTRREQITTDEPQDTWKGVELYVAWDWFQDLMRDTFEEHFTCPDCDNETTCGYRDEAWDCYMEGNLDYDEITQEFWKDCDESSREYGLAQMNEWKNRTVFRHEHGRRIRQLVEG